jgi:hypothetical protein
MERAHTMPGNALIRRLVHETSVNVQRAEAVRKKSGQRLANAARSFAGTASG